MASEGGAPAQGAGAPDGLPRDHQVGGRGGARRDPGHRPPPGRRPGGPAGAGPALRLRGFPGAVEEGPAAPVRGPRPVGRHADRRRAGARTDGLRARGLLDRRRGTRDGGRASPAFPRAGVGGRRQGGGSRPGLRPDDGQAQEQGPPPAAGRGGDPGRGVALDPSVGGRGEGAAVHPPPLRALHHVDPAAGGGAQAPVHGPAHDEGGPGAVRERLHHLHAHGFDRALRAGHLGREAAGRRSLRRRVPAGQGPGLRPASERPGGARGDPACRHQLPHAEPVARSPRPGLAAPLRVDLEADAGVPNEGRQGHQHVGQAGHVDAGGRRGPADRLRPGAALRRLSCGSTSRAATIPGPGRRTKSASCRS